MRRLIVWFIVRLLRATVIDIDWAARKIDPDGPWIFKTLDRKQSFRGYNSSRVGRTRAKPDILAM